MKIEVHDPITRHMTLEIAEKIGNRKFGRIVQIAQRIYFLGSVNLMDLFYLVQFCLVFIFWVSQKMSRPSPLSCTS